MYKYALSIMLLISLITISGATYVNMLEPYSAIVHNGSNVNLGKVGPGQTFYVSINASSTTNTGNYIKLGWNKFVVKRTPPGWIVENSPLNTKFLPILIKPSPNTSNGKYELTLEAINIGNYSGLSSLTFNGYITVTPDVFILNVSPSKIISSPGTPSKIFVTINNTGVSDNPFSISMTGLPAWNNSKTVIALHNTSKKFVYTVYENTPGVYNTKLHVTSISSNLVSKDMNLKIVERRGIINDYSAIGKGSITFSVIYEPAYVVMYLISLIFNQN